MDAHLEDDDLVLHYYGEMSDAEETHAAAHLARCSTCHNSYRRLQRVLAAVDDNALSGPELPDSYGRMVWAHLQPNLQRRRGAWLKWFVLSPVRIGWVVAVIVLVTGAFFMGRLLPRDETRTEMTQTLNSAAQVRERILLVDLGDHLERSQMVLVELVSADTQAPIEMAGERARVEQLVAANRLYRQTAAASGDAGVALLLDELERVLVDIAASPERMSPQQLDEVRQRIESKGLLFKVRVISSEVRARQKSAVQERTNRRSTL